MSENDPEVDVSFDTYGGSKKQASSFEDVQYQVQSYEVLREVMEAVTGGTYTTSWKGQGIDTLEFSHVVGVSVDTIRRAIEESTPYEFVDAEVHHDGTLKLKIRSDTSQRRGWFKCRQGWRSFLLLSGMAVTTALLSGVVWLMYKRFSSMNSLSGVGSDL